jgi:pSer/pThr/pTyr-binding forkhead associated (FHA) protein
LPANAQNSGDPLAAHSLSPRELQQIVAAERTATPFLVFRDADGELTTFFAGRETTTHTIGRGPEVDISIGWDLEVSGLHAELHGRGGEWTVADDGLSTNGTHVNDERVHGRRRLRDGDRLRIGQTVLVYKAPAAVRVTETVITADLPLPRDLTKTQKTVLIALCRPYRERGEFATPATNQQIAEEVFLSVDAVKMHLRTLFGKFELSQLPQNEKRARLAETVLRLGVVDERDLLDRSS